jgi:hypothetical protein
VARKFQILACLLISKWALAQAPGTPATAQQSPKAQQLPLSGQSQSGSVSAVQSPAQGASNTVNTIQPSIQVPSGTVLEDAIKRQRDRSKVILDPTMRLAKRALKD